MNMSLEASFLHKASEPVSSECVACLEASAFESSLEPTNPLSRTPMSKSIRDYMALRSFHNSVIPNCACSVEPLLDIPSL